MIFQSLGFLSWFPLLKVAVNKEATEQKVPNYIILYSKPENIPQYGFPKIY
jgi:hypothetical protein